MLRARPRSRTVVACCAAALVASVAAVPAPAVASAPTPTSITVFLKAPDPAGLDALAAERGLTRAQRVSAVNRLVPSAATHDRVITALNAEGFAITAETSWSITATGTAARASSLFGRRPTAGANPSSTRAIAARGPLPRVPSRLAASVSAVFPTRGGPAVFHHSSTGLLTGTDFRNADTPAHVAPSTGQHDAGATIATVQFADFYGPVAGPNNSKRAADLTSYAQEHGIADPVAAGRYKAVIVDGGPDPETDDDPDLGGDTEVALDQESILSTAPSANQHAYFAPDTDAGFGAAFAQVYDDAVGNSEATLPDKHIVALSSSWGACEAYTGGRGIAALEPILKSLVAAGVTIFAASGDDGIYDCAEQGSSAVARAAAVDYPASSPSVVGVGATALSAAKSAANTGSNWSEKSWTCTTASDCTSPYGNHGTGGGASGSAATTGSEMFSGFAAPLYQRAAIDAAPFQGNARRLVPDISANGDPASGFTTYNSDPDQSDDSHPVFGGTSLASPISAAQLANALSDAGHKSGVGDIHAALYSAYARTRSLASSNPNKVFRDVTSGANGAAANRRNDPSVTAQVGYDTVSGLGGVLWSALVPYLLDKHTPVAKTTLTLPKLHTTKWRQATATWTASRGSDSSLVGPSTVRITRSSQAKPVYQATTTTSGHRTFTATPGATYTISVTASDISGRKSPTVTTRLRVPIDDGEFTRSRGWQRASGVKDVAGTHLLSTKKGAALRSARVGRVYQLVVRTGPHNGTLGVYLHRKLIKRINLHTAKVTRKTVMIYSASRRVSRAFTFKALTANTVGIDGLYVTY